MEKIVHLNELRQTEIKKIVTFFPPGAAILEIGAGTGQQAIELAKLGFKVQAIDLSSSGYAGNRVFPIVDYDGRNIPFADRTFDVVFSSNVLEHVPDLPQLHREIARVLKPGGYAIHTMPTPSWRFWSTVAATPKAFQVLFRETPQLLPRSLNMQQELPRMKRAAYDILRHGRATVYQRRHGERGNAITELWYYRPNWWRKNFEENGFRVVHDEPMRLFYTGPSVFGSGLDMNRRERVSRILGSACHLYKVEPAGISG